MGYAVILVVVSLSILVAYMSWKTWPVINIILMVLIVWATMGFLYLAARTLKTHQAWRSAYNSLQRDVSEAEKQARVLAEGEGDQPGIRQLRTQLHRLTIDRGGVWFGAQPKNVDAARGVVDLVIDKPSPHNIVPKMIVFAFDSKGVSQGGRYVGEFHVIEAAPGSKAIKVSPLPAPDPDDKEELARLSAPGPWDLYATMPVDNPRLFEGLGEGERGALFGDAISPEASAEFSRKDRPLRDYGKIFHDYYVRRTLLRDAMIKLQSHIDRTKVAIAKTEQDIKLRQAEQQALVYDLAHFKMERQVAENFKKVLEAQLAWLENKRAAALKTNLQLVGQLTAEQLQAAEAIDRRTGPSRTDPRVGVPARP